MSGSEFVIVFHTFMVELDSQMAFIIFKCTFKLRLCTFADNLGMATDNFWALLKLLVVVLPRLEVSMNLKVKPKKTIATPPCGAAPTSTTLSGASRPSFPLGPWCRSR